MPTVPVLLYFTGHGSRNRTDSENNQYDLWGEHERLTVRELSKEIAAFRKRRP